MLEASEPVQLYIDGGWRPADGGTFDRIDPASEGVIGPAAQAQASDVEAAIEAAAKAFPAWRDTPPWQRSKVLRKLAQLIVERAEPMAQRLALEIGKPIAQARGEVATAADSVDWFADEARRIYGDVLPGRSPGTRFVSTYEPVGPVAAFTAWNFPIVLVARKIAPALAAGCTVVVRPAEEGSGAVAMLIQACEDAGVPPGVVNLVTGAPEPIADAVMASDAVRKITFTGSVPVGMSLARQAADTLKRVTMELGGHAPVIVWDDVDPSEAASAAATAKMRNNGQVCVSPTRFYLHEKVKDAFTERFVEAMAGMRLGAPGDEATEVGPLINRKRLATVESMVQSVQGEGVETLTGGKRPDGFDQGYYFEPTVFGDVSDDSRVMNEEPFGPIAPLTSFRDFDEVIARANSLKVGLAGYVLTGDLGKAERTVKALRTGIVCVNNYMAATAEMPFGGVGHTGYGRENGRGIMDYLDAKFANYSF